MRFICALLVSFCIVASNGRRMPRSIEEMDMEETSQNGSEMETPSGKSPWSFATDLYGSIAEKIPDNSLEKVKEGLGNLPFEKVKDTLSTFADKLEIQDKLEKIKESLGNLSIEDIGFDSLKEFTKHIPKNLTVSEGLDTIASYVPKEVREDETLNKYYETIKGQISNLGSTFGAWFSTEE